MDDSLKNKDELEACKKEMLKRAKEINNNYIEVWEASNDSFGDSEPDEGEDTSWSFCFHK